MTCVSCRGDCCAVFTFLDVDHPRFPRIRDAEFLADMLIPLSLIEAAERMDRLGVEPHWSDSSAFDWDGRSLSQPERRLMTCRHWDETTRLCTAYENRPEMCRDYPYDDAACDYQCGYSLGTVGQWDYRLKVWGPEWGTPPNIIRGEN